MNWLLHRGENRAASRFEPFGLGKPLRRLRRLNFLNVSLAVQLTAYCVKFVSSTLAGPSHLRSIAFYFCMVGVTLYCLHKQNCNQNVS